MEIKNYDQLTSMELDTLREIGSIGTGNAATALSSLLGKEVRIATPELWDTMKPLSGLVVPRKSLQVFW